MIIRPEQIADHSAIADATARAFADVEHSEGTEPAIVAAVRDAGALTLSLIAEDADKLIGHAAFSPVTIDGDDRGWFGLGPVAVRPDRQGEGVGGALMLNEGSHGVRQRR